MEQRTRRSPARWLAPLALIAVLVAFAVVVSGSKDEGGGSSAPQAGNTKSTTKTGSETAAKSGTGTGKSKGTRAKTYVVQIGDTLGSIAVKTDVSLDRLQELNPDVDSHLMTAGQRIRLR